MRRQRLAAAFDVDLLRSRQYDMTERFFRQTGEFDLAERGTAIVETALEFTELEVDGSVKDTAIKKFSLRRGAVRLRANDDGSFSTLDRSRTFDRV